MSLKVRAHILILIMKVAFWDNCLNIRGTSIALYDYAYYNMKLLGNESIIMNNVMHPSSSALVIEKFRKEFPVFDVTHFKDVDDILVREKCDVLYVIEAGNDMERISNVCKIVIHCVFTCNRPHGNVYASIAPWVSGNNGKYPHVPHMVSLPNNNNNMRA